MRIAASVFVTLFLLSLCAFLAGPAFELPAVGPRGGVAAGAAPQFVVVAVAVLAVVSLVGDLLDARRGRAAGSDADAQAGSGDVAESREVLVIGGAVLALLAGYVALWRVIGFPVASALFMMALSVVVAPRSARTPRGLAIMAVVAALFSVFVWLAFTRLLGVPLR